MRRWAAVSVGRFRQHLYKGRVFGCVRGKIKRKKITLKHVFDQDRTFCDVLFDDELLVIRGDKENHCVCGSEEESVVITL